MTEMEGLRQAILAQVTEEGEALLKEARHAHHRLLDRAQEEVMASGNRQRQQALSEVRGRYQRQLQQVDYQMKQTQLEAKQKVLNALFEEALSQMQDWDQTQLMDFLTSVLTHYQDKPFTLQLGQITHDRLGPEGIEALQAAYPNLGLGEPIPAESGWVVTVGRIDYNYLFSELIASIYQREGYQIAKQLFAD